MNAVQEFFFSCNWVGTIVKPDTARKSPTIYKTPNSHEAITVSIDNANSKWTPRVVRQVKKKTHSFSVKHLTET